MVRIVFKNVGQGDSILLEWEEESIRKYGIIDCNLYEGGNPILNEIISREIREIEFIILSHIHFDHFSGMAQLLDYCLGQSIPIKKFFHTFTGDFTRILQMLYQRKSRFVLTNAFIEKLYELIELKYFDEFESLSINTAEINLSKNIKFKVLAPVGTDYFTLSKQRARYESSDTKTIPNVNIVATILHLKTTNCNILLTSDATRLAFDRLKRTISDIGEFHLVQVPHHGSPANYHEEFWGKIIKVKDCNSVFSIGDEPAYKLPKFAVVEAFHAKNFYNVSTNNVYGIKEFYEGGIVTTQSNKGHNLAPFAKRIKKTIPLTPSRFFGDKVYHFP